MNWVLSLLMIGLIVKPASAGWWPFSSNNENVSMNVYFYYPNGQEVYLGRAKGISQCQNIASSFAQRKKVAQSDWDYLCCTIKKGSSCYEKLR